MVYSNTIYGTASRGGQFGAGSLFKLNTDGTGFAVLKHFRYPEWDTNSMSYIHTDGAVPLPGVVVMSNTLYGATTDGGQDWAGTLFKVNTDGAGFMVVKQFSDPVWDPVSMSSTNGDGATLQPGIVVSDDILYGATSSGGRYGVGTLFKVNLDGTGFTVLEHLGGSDNPFGGAFGLQGLVLGGNTLYGTSLSGGDLLLGAIFRIDLSPVLSITHTGPSSLAVSWPSVWTDYVLQQNLNGMSSLNWSNVTDTIQDDGTTKSFSLSPAPGNRYFRLFKP